jgi:hypothetical protein
MGFFNNVLRSIAGAPKTDLATKSTPTSNQNIYVSNAQSWDPSTHPDGRGDSQLVQDIDYNTKDGLTVTYRDGFTATYDNITPEESKAFSQAPSKGKWALSHLWGKPYK